MNPSLPKEPEPRRALSSFSGAGPRRRIIPLFLPALCCPGECLFCDQRAISGTPRIPEPEEISLLLRRALDIAGSGGVSLAGSEDLGSRLEVAFYGGSFTSAPIENQRAWVDSVRRVIPGVGIRVSARPDRLGSEQRAALREMGIGTVEVGCQSTDDRVLRLAGRNHTAAQVLEAVKGLVEDSFVTGLQIMSGLPGQTAQSALNTARELADLNPDFVRIYPLLVIRGTELEQIWRRGEYTPSTLEETIPLVADMASVFLARNIPVIRIGLHGEVDFRDNSVLAGPYHQSLGDLVYSRIFGSRLLQAADIADVAPSHGEERFLGVRVSPANVSRVWGFKACNRELLRSRGLGLRVSGEPEFGSAQMSVALFSGKPGKGENTAPLKEIHCSNLYARFV